MAETVGQKTQAKGHPGRHDTETQKQRYTQAGRQRNRDTHKQGDTETEILYTQTGRHRNRDTHKQGDTETEIHTNRDTQKQCNIETA